MKHLLSFALLSFLSFVAAQHDLVTKRACSGTTYTDALTQQSGCCDLLIAELFWIDNSLGLGICCPLGQILDGLTCVAPPASLSGGGICSGKAVCPNKAGSDLGIQYGHCYVLLSLSNDYLGHDSATKYIVHGENPGVVFRICLDKPECVASVNIYVPANGTWYMQDQFGDPTGTGFGWLGGSGDLTIQDSDSTALVVGGSPICYGGSCAICITFPPGGAAAPCPLPPGQSHLGVAKNPNTCQPFFFQEVPCRSEL